MVSTSSKQVSPTVIEPTGSVTHTLSYTVTLVNTGNPTATAAILTDTLPSSLTLTTGPTCSSGACAYNAGDYTVTWMGSLTPAAMVTSTVHADGTEWSQPALHPFARRHALLRTVAIM